MTDESSESCEMKKWDVFCENNDLLFENEQLQAENAELRKELAVTSPLFETLNDANDRLIYENMKLRELVRDMWRELHAESGSAHRRMELADRMHELGVEV